MIATAALGIAAGAIGIAVLNATARDTLRQQIDRANGLLSARMAEAVDARTVSLTNSLHLLAGRSRLRTLDPGDGDVLATGMRVLRSFQRMTLYDVEGRAVVARARDALVDVATLPTLPPIDPEQGAVVRIADRGSPPAAEIMVPVHDARRAVIGTLVGEVPMHILASELEGPVIQGGTAYLAEEGGAVLVSGEQDRVVHDQHVDLALIGTGDDVLVWTAATSTLPTVVVVELPEAVALSPVTTATTRLTLILVLVVTTIVAGVSLVTKRFLRPVRQLVTAVSSLGDAGPRVTAPSDAPAEIGMLSREFNQMADALATRMEELTRSREVLLATQTALREELAHVARTEAMLRKSEQRYARAYERERDAAEALRQLDRMKNTFLNAVSHELRTPLTSILGFAETLQDERLTDAEQRQMLVDRIAENGRRLDELLRDLLDIDRLSRGMMEPRRARLDLQAVIDRVRTHVPSLEGRRLIVQLDVTSAMVDVSMFERIVENLVANAAKHTPPTSSIWITSSPRETGFELVVEDDGPGIPEDKADRVFEAFQRDSPSAAPGTGIGLTLVSGFASLHGGRAWVEQSTHGGAAFHVSFPGPDDEPRAARWLTAAG